LKSFIEILKIDSQYQLDMVKTSPKIIQYFSTIEENYLQQLSTDTLKQIEIPTHNTNHSLPYSLLLPGLGHLKENQKRKGIILTSAGVLSLGSAIFYMIETNKTEKNYLNETDRLEIEDKYEDYNQAYKLRNIFILSYAIIWIYSQLDFIFFNDSWQTNYVSFKFPSHNQNRITPQLKLTIFF